MLVIFDFMKMEVSLFDGGRMLIKNVTDEKLAPKAYVEILRVLEVPRSNGILVWHPS